MKPIDQNVLKVIQNHFKGSHYAPTVQEIADALKINSTGYIHDSLLRLRDAGYVTWIPKKFRTIALTEAGVHYKVEMLA